MVRATSYTILKTCDHCILRSLVGGKDQDLSSSLHTQKVKAEGPKKFIMDGNLHEFLDGKLFELNKWHCLQIEVKGSHHYTITAFGSCVKWPSQVHQGSPTSAHIVESRAKTGTLLQVCILNLLDCMAEINWPSMLTTFQKSVWDNFTVIGMLARYWPPLLTGKARSPFFT